MSKLQSFFSKKWVLLASLFIYCIGAIGVDVDLMCTEASMGAYYLGGDIFIAVIMIVACVSFKNHSKNVMKAAVGGLLLFNCLVHTDFAFSYIFYPTDIVDIIFSCVLALLSLTFFINYLVLASNHKSNAFAVKLNMFVGVLIILSVAAWETIIIVSNGSDVLYGIFWILLNIGTVIIVMSIESKIDYFKQLRDEREALSEE